MSALRTLGSIAGGVAGGYMMGEQNKRQNKATELATNADARADKKLTAEQSLMQAHSDAYKKIGSLFKQYGLGTPQSAAGLDAMGAAGEPTPSFTGADAPAGVATGMAPPPPTSTPGFTPRKLPPMPYGDDAPTFMGY